MSLIFQIVAGILVIYLSLSIRWVPKPYNWVIEINFPGVPTKSYSWEPGIHFLWFPIKPIMFVRNKINMAQKPLTIHMGMSQGVGRPDPVDFKDTKAGVLVQIVYQVIDPIVATYDVQEAELKIESVDESGKPILLIFQGYERASINKIEADLRGFFGNYEFDEANEDSQKNKIEAEVLTKDEGVAFAKWGVKILIVDILDFIPEKEAADMRQRRLLAKTTAEVRITEAEGEKTATITIATGKKEAAQLAGEGELARLKAVKDAGLDPTHAAAYVLAQGSIEALGKTTTTVIATSEGGNLSQIASMAGMVKGVLGGGNQPPPSAPSTSPQSSSPASATPVIKTPAEPVSGQQNTPPSRTQRRRDNKP